MINNTASHFSNWVYLLKNSETPNQTMNLDKGRKMEIDIRKTLTKKFLKTQSESRIIYNGTESGDDEILLATELSVSGNPMKCKPDVVIETPGKSLVIIEYKYTNHIIGLPEYGWLNNRAQLWCYSKIDKFKNFRIQLILQFWNYNISKIPSIYNNVPPLDYIMLEKEIGPLFDTYQASIAVRNHESGSQTDITCETFQSYK